MLVFQELQIRGAIKDNSKIIVSYFSIKIYVVTPHKNCLDEDSSNDGSQNKFIWRNMDNYP